jgi:hypothetical protein
MAIPFGESRGGNADDWPTTHISVGLACAKHPDGVWPENLEPSVPTFEAPRSALTPGLRVAAPRVTIGAILYLFSLGLVGAATVGVLFGVGLVNADFAAPDRSPPPVAEIEPQPLLEAPTLASSEFAQDPAVEAGLVPEASGAAERSVRQFPARDAPVTAPRNASSASKGPGLGSTAHKAKPRPSPLVNPMRRSMAHNARLTPPTQTGPATLTPPAKTGSADTHPVHAG